MGKQRNRSCGWLGDTCCCRGDNFCFTAAITSHRPLSSTFGGTHLLMKEARAVKWERGRDSARRIESMSSCITLDPQAFFSSFSGESATAVDALTYTSPALTHLLFSSCFCVSLFLLLATVCSMSDGQQTNVNHCSLLIECFWKQPSSAN